MPLRGLVTPVSLRRYAGGRIARARDFVVNETLLHLVLNGREIVRLSCLPLHREYLALGFLKVEGYIEHPVELRNQILKGDIFSATVAKRPVRRAATRLSGCGGGISRHSLDAPIPSMDRRVDLTGLFSLERILLQSREFLTLDRVHAKTGGTHSAALADPERILFCTSDIGRHNALQKIVGWSMMENVPLEDKVLFVTGRVSAEIVLYCAAAGVPVLVSRAAPTSLALERAREAGLTLLGFARGGRCNVYAHPERLE